MCKNDHPHPQLIMGFGGLALDVFSNIVRTISPGPFSREKLKSNGENTILQGWNQPSLALEVYRVCFWMRSFEAASMKRTMVITNQKVLTRLATEAISPQKTDCIPTTRRYRDSKGKVRFAGTKRLKESQKLFYNSEVWFPTSQHPVQKVGILHPSPIKKVGLGILHPSPKTDFE